MFKTTTRRATSFPRIGEPDDGGYNGPMTAHIRWLRFLESWRRFRIFLRSYMTYFSLVLMAIIVVSVVFIAVLASGCSSPRMRNVYLLSLAYQSGSPSTNNPAVFNTDLYTTAANVSAGASLEVRVGHAGLCVNSNDDGWICDSSVSSLAKSLDSHLDPLNLLSIGAEFQNRAIISLLIIISAILSSFAFICIGFAQAGWREEIDEQENDEELMHRTLPPSFVVSWALILSVMSVQLVLVAVLWQHISGAVQSATVGIMLDSAVVMHIGVAATVLGWATVVLQVLTMLGLAFERRSISVDSREVE